MSTTWGATQFSLVDAVDIAKQSEKYSKIVMRIGKILDPNPIQEELEARVKTFSGAMPIVTSLRNENLSE